MRRQREITKKRWKYKRATLVIVIALVCACIAVIANKKDVAKERFTKKFPPMRYGHYSDNELKSFWINNFGLKLEKLRTFAEQFPEVKQRFDEGFEIIGNIYGKPINIKFVLGYTDHRDVMWYSGVGDKGAPMVFIVLPNVMNLDAWFGVIDSDYRKGQKELLYTAVLVGVMHELDHLRLNMKNRSPSDVDELVLGEKQAWAETCQYTISPLIEKYNRKVDPDSFFFYRKWIASGRDKKSQLWEAEIRKEYKKFADN
ncbi:MAG: hypothetical protein WC845_03980 [Candidatus Staskawiczbacteria bacterium]|jgi:hypothetical protein